VRKGHLSLSRPAFDDDWKFSCTNPQLISAARLIFWHQCWREPGFGLGFGVVNFAADTWTIARKIWRYQEGPFKEVTEPSKGTADISG
jgi:hypothetical protein